MAVATHPRLDEILDLLRARGGRITTPRRAIVTALLQSGGHITADELTNQIQADYPDVHLSTIYRCLDTLQELGVIDHVHLGHGRAVFHLADEARRIGITQIDKHRAEIIELDEFIVEAVAALPEQDRPLLSRRTASAVVRKSAGSSTMSRAARLRSITDLSNEVQSVSARSNSESSGRFPRWA